MKITENVDGTINMPIGEKINLIVGKKVTDGKLQEYAYKEIKIIDENTVEVLSENIFITPGEIIKNMDNGVEYLVIGNSINKPGYYQKLKYDEDGFTSNNTNYHY